MYADGRWRCVVIRTGSRAKVFSKKRCLIIFRAGSNASPRRERKAAKSIMWFAIMRRRLSIWLIKACFTPHVWLSRRDKLDCPDQLIFDLDPPGTKFALVRFAAKALRDFLDELGLCAFVKTTGSRGLHVIVALDRKQDFDTAREFAQDVARVLANRHPKRLTVEPRKNKRRGRLYLDTARNSYAQHAVAPYAVRAIEGARIATPLSWEEVNDSKVDAQRFTVKNIFQRLSRKSDPWKNLRRSMRSFKTARRRLDGIIKKEQEKR